MSLTVEINGRTKTLPDLAAGATLQELVTALNLKADRIAIEQNGEIVSREALGNVSVGDGDKIEIVHFVGGGVGNFGLRARSTSTIQNICYRT